MAVASYALSSISAFNCRTSDASSATRRPPVACLVLSTISPSSYHSMKVRNLSLRPRKFVPSFPLYSISPSATKVKRSAALTSLASAWNDEEEDNRSNSSRNLSVYVGNLPYTMDSAELAGVFKGSCNFSMVEVKYNQDTGRSRGFGFLTMDTQEDVAGAVEKFDGYEYQGRTLRVSSGPPPAKNNLSSRGGFRNERPGGRFRNERYGGEFRNERSGGGFRNERSGGGFRNERSGGDFNAVNRMFVGNLPWGADTYTLEQLFSDHGKVVDARVVYDRESGRSRGFGFVTMSSSEEMEAAIASLDGADMDGRPLRVNAAESKSTRV